MLHFIFNQANADGQFFVNFLNSLSTPAGVRHLQLISRVRDHNELCLRPSNGCAPSRSDTVDCVELLFKLSGREVLFESTRCIPRFPRPLETRRPPDIPILKQAKAKYAKLQ